MSLPPKIRKAPKRSSRWRSQAHLNFVRSRACSVCGSDVAVEAAHVRMFSGAGLGQKPDDFRAVSLCRNCHACQHSLGEPSFWSRYDFDVEELIEAFCKASPKAREIREAKRERENV